MESPFCVLAVLLLLLLLLLPAEAVRELRAAVAADVADDFKQAELERKRVSSMQLRSRTNVCIVISSNRGAVAPVIPPV
jgi:hypothetical protein